VSYVIFAIVGTAGGVLGGLLVQWLVGRGC
jgi:hypothetical protein